MELQTLYARRLSALGEYTSPVVALSSSPMGPISYVFPQAKHHPGRIRLTRSTRTVTIAGQTFGLVWESR